MPPMRLVALNRMVFPGLAIEAGRVICPVAIPEVQPRVQESAEGSAPSMVTRMSPQGLPWSVPGMSARSIRPGLLVGSDCSILPKAGGSGCDQRLTGLHRHRRDWMV